MTTSIRERVIHLLGQNIKQHIVAEAVGVTEGYISQLLAEEDVQQEVAKLKAESLEKDINRNAKIEDVADKALKTIESRLPYVKSAGEAAKVFQTLMNIKGNKLAGSTGMDAEGMQIVQITLPKSVRGSVNIQLNSSNQVIDVEGRSMAPLPSKALPQLAKELKQKAEDATPKLANNPSPQLDKTVAADKLATLPDIATTLNGVPCVL